MVLVDAFGSGADLAAELKAEGFRLVHVRSKSILPPYYLDTWDPEPFDVCLNVGEIFHQSLPDAVRCAQTVLAGSEAGVLLAQQLARMLALPDALSSSQALALRDKVMLAQAFDNAGLRAPKSELIDDPADVREVIARFSLPLVVKPSNSAMSDGVTVCSTAEEAHRACLQLLSRAHNILGELDRGVVIQEFLVGTEFALNVVSRNGWHVITDAWRYTKTVTVTGVPFYDYDELLRPDEVERLELRSQVERILDALGVTSGPSHVELIQGAMGPIAIDVAARLGGTLGNVLMKRATGHSQVRATVESMLPGAWKPPALPQMLPGIALRVVQLRNRFDGTARGMIWLQIFNSLPTCLAVEATARVGEPIGVTDTLATSPGVVFLRGPKSQVEVDYTAIRALEAKNCYVDY